MKTKCDSLLKEWLSIFLVVIGLLPLAALSPPPTESGWVEDAVPAGAWTGAEGGDAWNWVGENPSPFSGTLAHQSGPAPGIHYHYFADATETLAVDAGDVLIAYVFLDAANPPREIMLGWSDGTSWSHAAYWGEDLIPWGANGTAGRRSMGTLPARGTWVRLEVPAGLVGVEGRTLSGMGFVLYDGLATWDHAGKSSAASPLLPPLPVVQVVASDAQARRRESNGAPNPGKPNPGEFVFWRNGDTNSDLTVYYTPGGTTTNGADYETLPGSVTIPAGANYATVPLMPFTNGVDGGSVVLSLDPDAAYTAGSFSNATVTIVSSGYLPDAYISVNVFAIKDAASENGPDPGVFIVTRSQADYEPLGPMTVYYRLRGGPATGCGPTNTMGNASNGVDFEPVSGTVIIPAGANFSTVTIMPVDDAAFKGTRSVVLRLAQNCQAFYNSPEFGSNPKFPTVFIKDNDPPPTNDIVWVDDILPDGAWPTADGGDGWNWVSSGPTPFSGSLAHQSSQSPGLHEHFFNFAANPLVINTGDVLFAYAYLDPGILFPTDPTYQDPANATKELMLSWCDGTGWEHRAYWGANNINYGEDGTAGRYYMGLLPKVGEWVRLEVPAGAVGLEGVAVQGMSFSLFDGWATWDAAGKSKTNNPPPQPPQPPTAPTNLRVTHRGYEEIDLAWDDNSTDETGFIIESKHTDYLDHFVVRATVGPNVTRFAMTGLREGDSFSFLVRAVRDTVSSDYSNPAGNSVTVTPILNATGATSSSISLHWSEPVVSKIGPGNGPYSLERSIDNVNFVEIAGGLHTTSYNRTDYADAGLPPATRYYYRVRYLNANGDTSGYGTLPPIGTDGPPPAAPTRLSANALSPTAVQLAWTKNSNNEISFDVERSTDGVSFRYFATAAANTEQYTDSTVSAATTYYYRVRAILTPATRSDYSNTASATAPSPQAPQF